MFMKGVAKRLRYRQESRSEAFRCAFSHAPLDEPALRFYLQCTNKQELLDVLVKESFTDLYEALDVLLKERVKGPVRQLKRWLRRYVESRLKYPSDYQLALVVRKSHDTNSRSGR